MANSLSVKAILSAVDKGFSSTFEKALNTTDKLSGKIKSGIGFGVLTGIGQRAFDVLVDGARDLISEIDSSNAAWKNFESNLQMLGKSGDYISDASKEMKKFAEDTVYSSSDMATTYAQLEAVGTKSTLKLVKGFGGLAAAAENPQQAMKTLSMQATQMAAKPKVAWEDFKLMLEQTPAGIAAIARDMNMSTSELVASVQEGTLATDDFFDAIARVGGSDDFYKLATEAKTAGQAMSGLKETLGNKLTPAFDVLSEKAITGIESITNQIAKIDAKELERKLTAGLKAAEPYWDTFVGIASEAGSVVKTVTGFLAEHSDTISEILPYVLGLAVAYKGFKVVNSAIPGLSSFTSIIGQLAGKGLGALATKIFGLSKSQDVVGESSSKSATKMLASAKAYALMGVAILTISTGFALLAQSAIALANAGPLAIGTMAGLVIAVGALSIGVMAMMNHISASPKKMSAMSTAMLKLGTAVLLVSAGFALLSYSAISLANAGTPAIACMVGMVAVIALLAVGAAALGPALVAGAAGFTAFGAAILMVSAGALLASAGIALLAGQLPTIATYGLQSATAITALGGSLVVFAVGATTAGASLIALGAGFGVAAVGVVAFGAGMVTGAAGTVAMAAALKAVNSSMKSISTNAKNSEKSLKNMNKSVDAVESGLNALGDVAKNSMKSLINAFDQSAAKSQSAGRQVGLGFTQGLQSGSAGAVAVASKTTTQVVTKLRSGRDGAYSAGAYISLGFAQGMRSQLGAIRSAANEIVAAANKAIEAKAKIHSPSDVTDKYGFYYGKGLVNGLLGMVKDAQAAAEKLICIPAMYEPELAFAGTYGGELSDDYEYHRSAQYTIIVPLDIDGREFARAEATYIQEELNKRQTRENRKKGKI